MPDSRNTSTASTLSWSDLQTIASDALASGYRELDAFQGAESFDGGEENVLIQGDLGPSCTVERAGALVIKGNVIGSDNAPCVLKAIGPVVVMGAVRFARIEAGVIYLGKGAQQSRLFAAKEVSTLGDLTNTEIDIGRGESLKQQMESAREKIAHSQDMREDLNRQIRIAKNRLNNLLQATGIVFNLNIGHIVRQDSEGLVINLTPFYNALGDNRSEEEVDHALKEFFAKAMLGLLTRVNRHYISESRGHRKRFSTVIGQLQDLVYLTRNFDKHVMQSQHYQMHMWEQLEEAKQQRGTVCVAGGVMPPFRVCFSWITTGDNPLQDQSFQIEQLALTLRHGKIQGKDEVVLWRDEKAIDLVFVPVDSLKQVVFYPEPERVTWSAIEQA